MSFVVFLAAVVSLMAFATRGGFAAPPMNPVFGGGPAKTDCYIEFDVKNATNIANNKTVTCTDGDPCDTDGKCDGTCTFSVALCPNQTNVTGCTPQPPVTLSGKSIPPLTPPTNLSGSDCGAFADVKVSVKGKKKKKPGKTTLHVTAKASAKPKTDRDNVKFVCVPRTGTCPTTTTTTVSASTTTTIPCTTPSGALGFTTAPGTATCGGPGLASPAPAAPFSGEVDSDTAGTTKIIDLGLGCLYIGGGNATVIPPSLIPDGATNYFNVSGMTLAAVSNCPAQCTKAAGPGKHCVNAHCNTDADCDGAATSCQATKQCVVNTDKGAPLSCTADTDCGGSAGSCALDANCYFGPPLPIRSPAPFGSLTTCVLNVIATDASGTGDTTAGTSTVAIPLSSRVYITGNTASPCPACVSGACSYGPKAGVACTTTSALMTTLDCPPSFFGFQAPLPVTLSPLTTGAAEATAADGNFCPSQAHAGAFGQTSAKRITETGSPGGNLSDHMPHPSILAATFCIPPTNNPAVDGVADLPGPGAIGLNGTARLTP